MPVIPRYNSNTRAKVIDFVREHYDMEEILRRCPDSITHAFIQPYHLEVHGGFTFVRKPFETEKNALRMEMEIRNLQETVMQLKANIARKSKLLAELWLCNTSDEIDEVMREYQEACREIQPQGVKR